ncbi:DUF2786 domain-containing protein [Desulfogranum japonicum]|uniref:DUF2786 domain-containing protein n=1 Tax=Desulfogranum japonicum TaxID=231447 RepID=UPI0003F79FB3|nr:DUF2786 domain-containing protein [Desulfogranum japonicum]
MPQNLNVFEQNWLRQLQKEWEDIQFLYDLPLARPIFQLSRSTTVLGSWDEQHRILTLSSFLIQNHSWQITMQVFKHEIAHQCCSEMGAFHKYAEKGHGPGFKKACELLGVDPPFQRAQADTEQALHLLTTEEHTSRHSRILEKVRKLLQLGGSSNEHEAAAALAKAGELMQRHSIELDQFDEQAGITAVVLSTGKQRLSSATKGMCGLLNKYFSVRVIIGLEYDPLADREYRTIEIYGTEEQVAIAEHCYHFLQERLDTLWLANKKRFAGTGITGRKSFELGLLSGFAEKLEQQAREETFATKEQEQQAITALVRLEQRVDEYVQVRHPKLKLQKSRRINLHAAAYNQAQQQGRALDFNKPVTANDIRMLT